MILREALTITNHGINRTDYEQIRAANKAKQERYIWHTKSIDDRKKIFTSSKDQTEAFRAGVLIEAGVPSEPP